MTRYFFNVRDGVDRIDDEGTELAGMPEARRAAMQICSELLRRDEPVFWEDPNWQLEVTDALGLVLFTVYISAMDSLATAEK